MSPDAASTASQFSYFAHLNKLQVRQPQPGEGDGFGAAKSKGLWAWTLGGGRPVNEAFFAVEITNTRRGQIHIGIATDDKQTKASECGFQFRCPFSCKLESVATLPEKTLRPSLF